MQSGNHHLPAGRGILTLALALPALSACSGGSGGGGPFALLSTNGLENGIVWQINRPIELTFSQPVDLSSASFASVQIEEIAGAIPALGSFYLKPACEGRTLVFQPLCPTSRSFENGGLKPRGVHYRLSLPARATPGPNLLRSRTGASLVRGLTREFSTPLREQEFFYDPLPQAAPSVAKIFLGGQLLFPDPLTGASPAGAIEIGLNSFSHPIAPILLLFDQPLRPSPENLSGRRIQLLFEAPGGEQVAIPVLVELVENCGIEGSTVLLSPLGLLPPGAEIRLRIKRELEDIVGETNLADVEPLRFRVQGVRESASDVFTEEFDSTSYLDEEAVFPEPRAAWSGGGTLEPATSFEGTNQDFDWVVDVNRIIDTDYDTITNLAGTQTLPVVNGIVDIRSLHITAAGNLIGRGSNPLVIFCSADALIEGGLRVSGTNARRVASLCSTAIPEVGAPGLCGGGSGGTGSWETTTSTPRGGTGNGPFELAGSGGLGGESALGMVLPAYRAGGGGGGTWRPGSCSTSPPSQRSAEGRCGIDGDPSSRNVAGSSPARGGAASAAIFADGDPRNDFFGIGIDSTTGELLYGELGMPQGGAGGGAGGDGIQWSSFPSPRWNNANPSTQTCDLKGAGGAGGAGVVVIKALGRITVSGSIEAVGGAGASGEAKGGLDPTAGGSGAGAGGQIILMSSNLIDLRGATIDARGGSGGPGRNNAPYPVMSAGGHGGAGVIQYHITDPANHLLYNGASPPGDPTPLILIPDFGARSVAQTRWITTGFSDPGSGALPDPPFYWFEGTWGGGPEAGMVRRTAGGLVEPPPRHFQTQRVRRADFGAHTLVLPAQVAQVDNPALLILWEIGDEIAANSGQPARTFTITSARYEGGRTYLGTDPADGDLTQLFTFRPDPGNPAESWAIAGIYPRYLSLSSEGVEDRYPPSTALFITFQGADAEAGDPGRPDLATLVPNPANPSEFAADVEAVAGKRFFRVRFTFDLDHDLGGLSATSPRLALHFFKLPFRF